jgi:hypothetical protein
MLKKKRKTTFYVRSEIFYYLFLVFSLFWERYFMDFGLEAMKIHDEAGRRGKFHCIFHFSTCREKVKRNLTP